jgi:hypothetical protein
MRGAVLSHDYRRDPLGSGSERRRVLLYSDVVVTVRVYKTRSECKAMPLNQSVCGLELQLAYSNDMISVYAHGPCARRRTGPVDNQHIANER